MRLGIDAREIQSGVCTGIGRPLLNFLKFFPTLMPRDQCLLFSNQPIPLKFPEPIRNIVIPENNTWLWDQWILPQAIHTKKVTIFYSPYYKIPVIAKCPTIAAILDLMYLVYPAYKKKMSVLKKHYYYSFGKHMAHKATRILTCSHHSKKDIVQLYHIDPKKIVTIPLSISSIYRPEKDHNKIRAFRKKNGLERPYLLYLGNFKIHKNVRTLIQAFNDIHDRHPDLTLVLAGPKTHEYSDLKKKISELKLNDHVRFIGKIMEDDQPHLLYSAADIFIMPSLYEGFGLPPAEAIACGTPVIAAKTASLPEVVGEAGFLVNAQDSNELARAMIAVLKDQNLKDRMVQKGFKHIQSFEEERVAQQMANLFISVKNAA